MQRNRHELVAPAALVGMITVLAAIAPAQYAPPPAAVDQPDPVLVRLRETVNPEFEPWSPAYVVERCAEHLATLPPALRPRVRYLSLADVPRTVLPAATSALFFAANSAARVPVSFTPRAIPNADGRIFWVDLAWGNWRDETWESISGEDPYFREPLVPSGPGLSYLKSQTNANAVIRGDWFTHYVLDNGEFINGQGTENFNEKSFYYQLVYSAVEFTRAGKKVRGVGPATADEFEKAWFVDFDHLKEFPIDKGAMVDKGFSGVSYQNRVVWRVRGKVGTYWRTFDVFRTAGDQDFVQTPFPKVFNAGEHIFQDERGAQYYHLSNGQGQSVDFANPFVVRGDPANVHNSVLVTARSCVHCHDTGVLAFRNEHLAIRGDGVSLRAIDPSRAERFNQFFYQADKMARLVRTDQDNYAAFVREVNGLTPQQNVQNFVQARTWYGRDVDLVQAAREHGVSAQVMADALAYGPGTPDDPAGVTQGRLGRLAIAGQPVPRHYWERGGFQEAGLILLEHRKAAKMRSK